MGRERGQATVELALCLPLVALIAAAIVEIGLLSGERVRLWHAAREAARIAAVDPDADAVRAAAARSGLTPLVVDIDPDPRARVRGAPVSVSLEYRRSTRIPLVGGFLAPTELSARATMRIEQP